MLTTSEGRKGCKRGKGTRAETGYNLAVIDLFSAKRVSSTTTMIACGNHDPADRSALSIHLIDHVLEWKDMLCNADRDLTAIHPFQNTQCPEEWLQCKQGERRESQA